MKQYIDAFVEAYKNAPPFPTIKVDYYGFPWELGFTQHARILFWDGKASRPAFIPEAPATVGQYWYYCAQEGHKLPVLQNIPIQENTPDYPITNVSAADVARYYNWLNRWYGFKEPYKVKSRVKEDKISILQDDLGFFIPNEVEQKWITHGLESLPLSKLTEYCWLNNNSGGQIKPVKTEARRYINKYQHGTLLPDGTYLDKSIGMLGPAGNVYWMAYDRR